MVTVKQVLLISEYAGRALHMVAFLSKAIVIIIYPVLRLTYQRAASYRSACAATAGGKPPDR